MIWINLNKRKWLSRLKTFLNKKKIINNQCNWWLLLQQLVKYQSNGDRNKTLLIEEYIDEIKVYLKDITNNLKKSDTCKTPLPIATNFISSKDID